MRIQRAALRDTGTLSLVSLNDPSPAGIRTSLKNRDVSEGTWRIRSRRLPVSAGHQVLIRVHVCASVVSGSRLFSLSLSGLGTDLLSGACVF